jgi:hypothetical protein
MASHIVRRKFLATLGGAAAAWPVAARAQQQAMPVIGFVRSTTPEDSAPFVAAFRRGLGESDYVEGQNVAIEYRYAFNQIDRLPALMAEPYWPPRAAQRALPKRRPRRSQSCSRPGTIRSRLAS